MQQVTISIVCEIKQGRIRITRKNKEKRENEEKTRKNTRKYEEIIRKN